MAISSLNNYVFDYGCVIGGAIVSHPLMLVRTLIQVGFEPIRPKVQTSYIGTKLLIFPGLASYARHIVKVDGWRGLFRGVVPSVTYAVLLEISMDLMEQPVTLVWRCRPFLRRSLFDYYWRRSL